MAREMADDWDTDDWDTDDVSVTSTVAAPEGNYEVERILAEKWDVWHDEEPDKPPFRGIKYLTKWDGYGLHESTWEPKSSFNPPDEYGNILPGTPLVLGHWYAKKKSIAELEFRNYCQKHEDEFVEAVEKAEAERLIKLAKGEKKRKKATALKKRARPVVSDKDDDNEPTPSRRSQKRVSPKNTAPPEVAREGRDPMSARNPRGARKPPIVQSESSLSESDLTEDSMMEELDENKTTHESTGARGTTEISKPRLRSAQSNRTPSKPAATATNPNPAARPSRNKSGSAEAPQTSSKSSADVNPQVTNPPKDMAATNSNGSPERTDTHPLASARQKSTADRSTKATAPASSERSGIPTPSTGIKIVNQPKTQLRSEWRNGKSHFSTLHYRAVAQKRSRNEGTLDLAALEIVNDPYSNVRSKAQAVDDVPYNTSAKYDGLSEGSSGTPLEPWEVDKVPLVCASWRLSSNCPRSAQNCFFLHRNKDPDGHDYPVGDPAGQIPHKYRKPPLACSHWLYKPNGCYKSDEQCDFAHRNTGWILSVGQSNGKPAQINRDLRPQSEKAHGSTPQSPGILRKKSMPPHELTCWYWANGACRNTPEACSFQHHDTGIVADGPLANGTQQGFNSAVEQTVDAPLFATDVSVDMETNPVTGTRANAGSMCPPQHTPNHIPPNGFFPPPPPPPPPIEFPLPEATCEKLQKRIHSVCRLDFQEMFARNDSKGSTTLMDRRAFLVFHPEQHSEELELITRWLLMHHVQIACTHYQGAWPVFQQQIKRGGSGVVIVHPDFEYFTELPGLGQILRCQIRIWSVGLQEGIEYDPALSNAPPVCRYAPIEVFPVGGFIYITDEVFEREPQLALRIVELFFEKIARLKQLEGPLSLGRQVDDASLLWRICVRPELMEHLTQYCKKHEDKLEAGNADMQSRAQLYRILAETNYIEQDDSSELLSLVPDKFPILSERRIIADCEPVDYFNTLARSQEDANTNMIRYYAGLQVDMRRDYRHFFIVHTEPIAPCVQRWKQEIQTIAGVLTPGKCAQELSKSSEDSMFDFCERFMPEKPVKEQSG